MANQNNNLETNIKIMKSVYYMKSVYVFSFKDSDSYEKDFREIKIKDYKL